MGDPVTDGEIGARGAAIGNIIEQAVAAHRRTHKRHPLEVTSDRIATVIEQYSERLSGADKDTLSNARYIIEDLIGGSDA